MEPECIVNGCGGRTEVQMKGPHYHRVCLKCGTKQHKDWLSKSAAGVCVRSVQSTHAAIKPKQRSRILERAAIRCEICGKSGVILHVGHFLSVDVGLQAGMTDDEINADENLYCSCEECNLGQGSQPVSIRVLMNVIRGRLRNE
jgi:5-methylcytosine-specific restriction endonuclease McrA